MNNIKSQKKRIEVTLPQGQKSDVNDLNPIVEKQGKTL